MLAGSTLAGCAGSSERVAPGGPLIAYVGTFSSPLRDMLPTQVDLPPGNGRGIHVFRVDRGTGALAPAGIVEMGTSPSCLAVNDAGTIRGTYYDGLTDSTKPVYGAVDKKTQRAAWTIGKDNNTVFDTGFYNLTKDETPVLVHIGKDRTQQWMLVRMAKPNDEGAVPTERTAAPSGGTPAQQATALVTVLVPADAEVFFEGDPTTQTGTERRFVTPPLTVGGRYSYTIRARWTQGGKTVEKTRKVQVTGGANVRVDFRTPPQGDGG